MPDTTSAVAPTARGHVQYDATYAIALATGAQHSLAEVREYVIDSHEMYEMAARMLQLLTSKFKAGEEQRVAITGPLHQAQRAVNDFFRPGLQTLQDAIDMLKRMMLAYQQEQQRIADEARRMAEEEARAERERLAAEQARREAEARAAAEAAERAEREAAAARAAGDAEAAARAQEQARQQAEAAQAAAIEAQVAEQTAAVLTIPAAVAEPPRVTGISTSKTVDFEVLDKHALIRHVAQHPELVDLLAVDSVRLRAQVRATGLKTALPGVRVYPKSTMAARRAA